MGALLASVVACYVGCLSGTGESLHVLEFDTETGEARLVQSLKGPDGTTYFDLDREGHTLYTCLAERRDGRPAGALVKFALGPDGRIGAMTRLADLPCEAPCHVALSPDGRRLAFAAYVSATCGTVGVDGRGLATFTFPDDETGPCVDRQQKAYAHQAFFKGRGIAGLAGCELGVVDLGCDRIWFFNPVTMERRDDVIRFDAGDGPRHAVLSADGRHLFVLCELSSRVCSFAIGYPLNCIREQPPAFTRSGGWSTLPEGTDMRFSKAAAIRLSDDGKVLMASNRGHDSIAFFGVGEDGALTPRNIAKLRGRFPRDFVPAPGGKFLVAGHKLSDEVQVYRVDWEDGTLSPVGKPLAVKRPLCFKFAPTPLRF